MGKIGPIVGLAIVIGLYFHFSAVSFDPKAIAGKRVLVTGASSGIGEQLAYRYAKLGARVFITARRANLLENVAKKCKELGAKQVEFVASDLGRTVDRTTVVSEVRKRFGGLDILLLNHAIVSNGRWLGSKENMTILLRDLDVNFVSFVELTSLTLDMLQESEGSIGVVSSVGGKMALPFVTSYIADKHALQGFFLALRQEMMVRRTGVSVTVCVIGAVDTDMMKADKEKLKKFSDEVLLGYEFWESPEATAEAIMIGVDAREREIYFGKMAWTMVTLHKLFPDFMESMFANRGEVF